ncbi:MAG: S-layer homology domain-containing protein [Gloeomargaritaceae cyanobacterium C42_A2020_066]|nr:S-layer homology domain-containing protein [Gloeomargaritaceae cyanobacterium C42_A2020_066]
MFDTPKPWLGLVLLLLVTGCREALAPDPQLVSPAPTVTPAPAGRPTPLESTPQTPGVWPDADQIPTSLQPYLQDLTRLGVLTAGNAAGQFLPNQPLTRRELARWLVATYNRYHPNDPNAQIRLAGPAVTPIFTDVPASDPDFGVIQGLADAGLIPSPLTGQATQVSFRPDAPVTRETLLLWKGPLDSQGAVPNASLEAITQVWGFKDVSKLDPQALGVVLADHALGEQSTIRRVWGRTLLLQPQKSVTRAEAAAALWAMGPAGRGVTAADMLNRPTPSAVSPSPQSLPSTPQGG